MSEVSTEVKAVETSLLTKFVTAVSANPVKALLVTVAIGAVIGFVVKALI